MATEHLIELGHREIGFINGPSGSYANTLFALGYRTAMDKHGIPIHDHLVMEMPWGEESGKKAIETWLSSSFPLPSAILAIEELMALGVMRCAIEKGYAIPDDLSVAGYSNRLEPSVYPVPLTTVDTLTCKQDNLAVDLLADLMAGKADKRKLRIEPELVVRLSCSRPVKSSRTQTMSKL